MLKACTCTKKVFPQLQISVQLHLYLFEQERQFFCFHSAFMLCVLYPSLLRGLCNPTQRLVYCVKGNLVLLSFEYKKRMILSVLLLKKSCYLHLVPAAFWKIPPIRGTSTSWRNQKKPQSSTRSAKPCTWERTIPHISISWGATSRKAACLKGPWGTWWMLC